MSRINPINNLPEELTVEIYKHIKNDVHDEIKSRNYKTLEDFSDCHQSIRKNVMEMYNAITELDLWEEFCNDKSENIIFTDEKWLKQLSAHPHIIEAGHSGFTMSWCLEYLQKKAQKKY